MNFTPDMLEKVLDGSKTVTRRPYNPKFPLGQYRTGRDYAICPGRGKHQVARMRVLVADLDDLGAALTEWEANREGFVTPDEFKAKWVSLYGRFDPFEKVWRIQFEVIR